MSEQSQGDPSRICAWCGVPSGEDCLPDRSSSAVTHGICDSCLAELFRNWNSAELQKFLDCLAAPVLLVNHVGKIVAGNRCAEETFQRQIPEFKDAGLGTLIECSATVEGVCGQSPECSGCLVRDSVSHTVKTGQGVVGTFSREHRTQGTRRYRLSTEKRGEAVLVRIEFSGTS